MACAQMSTGAADTRRFCILFRRSSRCMPPEKRARIVKECVSRSADLAPFLGRRLAHRDAVRPWTPAAPRALLPIRRSWGLGRSLHGHALTSAAHPLPLKAAFASRGLFVDRSTRAG